MMSFKLKFLSAVSVAILLTGCGPDPVPCMKDNEKGTVIRARTDSNQFCGRGGCRDFTETYININVNGVSRTCIVEDAVVTMFTPGEVINLQTGRRL